MRDRRAQVNRAAKSAQKAPSRAPNYATRTRADRARDPFAGNASGCACHARVRHVAAALKVAPS
jgi:hypothetical protein